MSSVITQSPSIEKLNENNYHVWMFKIKMLLVDRDLWDIVSGVEFRPMDSVSGSDFGGIAWDKRERKAMATICLNVSDLQLPHVRKCSHAKEAWDKLALIHQGRGLANVLFLRRRFFSVSMSEGQNMQQHINDVMTMVEKLEAVGASVTEKDIIMTLLCSLPDSYASLIISLESLDDSKLTQEYVVGRLLQEELRRSQGADQNQVGGDAAFYAKSGMKNLAKPASLKRFLPRRSRENDVCRRCQKKGHWERDCRVKLPNDDQGKSVEDQHVDSANVADEDDNAFVAANIARVSNSEVWLIDSGASQHLCSNKSWFTELKSIPARDIFLGDDRAIQAFGIGSVASQVLTGNSPVMKQLNNVLYVPKLASNLLSVRQLTNEGFSLEFDADGCTVRDESAQILVKVSPTKNLYKLKGDRSASDVVAHTASAVSRMKQRWHERLGHLEFGDLQSVKSKGLVQGMDWDDRNEDDNICVACVEGKQHRTPFPTEGARRAEDLLEIVHSDVCGPMRRNSLGGGSYLSHSLMICVKTRVIGTRVMVIICIVDMGYNKTSKLGARY